MANNKTIFQKEDLLLFKAPALVIAASCVVSAVFYFASVTFSQQAQESYDRSVVVLNETSNSVTQIAEEEATIIRYIDRYRDLVEDEIVGEEDRLEFLELIDEVRNAGYLYPVRVEIGEQVSTQLQYDPYEASPGEPVAFRSSNVALQLSLLHEGDLITLMNSLLSTRAFFQPTECSISSEESEFTTLRENLAARCTMLWHTFSLDVPVAVIE